ncbi:hypothetical protein CY35_10G044700 [Sphagnum magellanicum]|nr:hypothetical protein CY35_10G044700 [Sphagnum magellanicum]
MGTQVISMVGGDGEFSYQRMGVLQENAIRRLEPLMAEAVKQISLPQQGPLHIADFGTSTGRNSINYINFILKCVADRYVHKAGENNGHATCMPEMLVSFIDLPGNDFNNLIQLLASEAKNAKDLAGSLNSANVGRASSYFSAITAGSFYNRLLPKESLHFALSTFSLHWLSQGVITAETRDTFNLPIYFRSKEEVEASVIKCGAFDVQYLQSLDDDNLCPEDELMHMLQFPQSFATFFSAWMRALFGPIMEAHMGQHNTDEFFIRHQRRIAARATSLLSDPKAQQEYKILSTRLLLVVLKRKVPSTYSYQ